MARPQLRSPDQPAWKRGLLWLFEFASSLKLAVVLIFSSAFVLGWATFIESAYSTPAAQFGIYATWWFTLLNALLAVNIFSAAAIRYPWKRHQTGFVITHIGLLTLLTGCLIQRLYGVDAQMPVFEGATNDRAMKDIQQFALVEIKGLANPSDPLPEGEAIKLLPPVRFEGGPFNWEKYETGVLNPWDSRFGTVDPAVSKLSWLPWAFATRDRGVLLDEGGVKLEVLDYYADSEEQVIPRVELGLSLPRREQTGPDGKSFKPDYEYVPFSGSVRDDWPATEVRAYGNRMRPGGGGGTVSFGMTRSAAETQHFRDSKSEGVIGPKGQIVLHAAGQRFVLQVDEAQKDEPTPLGDTGITAKVTQHDPAFPRLAVEIAGGDKPATEMVLYADTPEFNLPDDGRQVYGSYWNDEGQLTTQQKLMGQGRSRIDVLQGADQKLYYRVWNGHEVTIAAELPAEGEPVDAFKMPIDQLKLKVVKHQAADKVTRVVRPLAFSKGRANTWPVAATRAAKIRLTVDGQAEEFWVTGPQHMLLGDKPVNLPPLGSLTSTWHNHWRGAQPVRETLNRLDRHLVQGKDRTIAVRFPLQQYLLGHRVKLRSFSRQLDPGTSQDSAYTSIVDFIPHDAVSKAGAGPDGEQLAPASGAEPLKAEQVITMNAPIDFSDPGTDRSNRFFQESFYGPFKPGDGTGIYEQFFSERPTLAENRPDQVFVTVLTVNYDPGRGVKYIGAALVTLGITCMFYMRAYFFKPMGRVEPTAKKQEPVEKPRQLAAVK